MPEYEGTLVLLELLESAAARHPERGGRCWPRCESIRPGVVASGVVAAVSADLLRPGDSERKLRSALAVAERWPAVCAQESKSHDDFERNGVQYPEPHVSEIELKQAERCEDRASDHQP
jgi:hypothetical protein